MKVSSSALKSMQVDNFPPKVSVIDRLDGISFFAHSPLFAAFQSELQISRKVNKFCLNSVSTSIGHHNLIRSKSLLRNGKEDV